MSLMLNVGGDWEFCFDPEVAGAINKWYLNKPAKTKKVSLPHVWAKEQLPAEGASVGFYFKTFTVDKDESSKRFFIRFDSVHQHATVWLNGEEIGTHLGGYITFDVDASKQVLVGEENFLAVRVQTPNQEGMLNNYPENELPVGYAFQKGRFAGIFGDIHFLMGGRAGIQYINCYPDYEAEWVTVETKFWNPKNYKAELEFTLFGPNGEKDTLPKLVKLDKENGTYSITFSIDKAQEWNPVDPQMYKVQVKLLGSYSMECKFGLRRVEIERCNIKINHRYTKLRGVNYNQFFPFYNGMSAFPLDIEKDLENIKASGFNIIRSCGAPLDNATLDICDRLGLMVIQETTCYNQKSNKESLENLKDHIRSIFSSTGHHPSIIMWAIGAENGSMVLENGNKLLRFASELDPYRPIVSNLNSVYMDSEGKGKIDLGKVFDPTEGKIEPFESHKLKISYPVATTTQNLLVNYCSSKEAKSINDGIHGGKSFWERYNYLKDELGGKVMVDGLGVPTLDNIHSILNNDKTKKFSKEGEVLNLKELIDDVEKTVMEIGVWKDVKEFYRQSGEIITQGLGHHIDSFVINTQFSGYFFENWADYDSNTNGLVNWYRDPKPTLEIVKKLNQPIKIMSEAEVRTPYMGTSAAMQIHLFNDGGLGEYGLLVRVKGPNGRIWHQESMPGVADNGVNSIGRFKFPVGFEKGQFTFDLTLSEGKKEIAKKEEIFYVPPKVDIEPLLAEINFQGEFSDSITYNKNNESNIIIAHHIKDFDVHKLSDILSKVKNGATLVLGALTREDVDLLNKTKSLGTAISGFRSSWTNNGCFHFTHKIPEFKDLPHHSLMSQSYADVLPIWSFEKIEDLEEKAGCIHITDQKLGTKKVKRGVDIGTLPLGNGKLVFYQYRIFNQIGTNALADVLFFNLVNSLKKG